jgi:hypothetical protein
VCLEKLAPPLSLQPRIGGPSTISKSFAHTLSVVKILKPLPSQIAARIYDSGHIGDRGSAERLEQRILPYGATKGTEAHTQASVQVVHRLESTQIREHRL